MEGHLSYARRTPFPAPHHHERTNPPSIFRMPPKERQCDFDSKPTERTAWKRQPEHSDMSPARQREQEEHAAGAYECCQSSAVTYQASVRKAGCRAAHRKRRARRFPERVAPHRTVPRHETGRRQGVALKPLSRRIAFALQQNDSRQRAAPVTMRQRGAQTKRDVTTPPAERRGPWTKHVARRCAAVATAAVTLNAQRERQTGSDGRQKPRRVIKESHAMFSLVAPRAREPRQPLPCTVLAPEPRPALNGDAAL